jgi:hypothetical protein
VVPVSPYHFSNQHPVGELPPLKLGHHPGVVTKHSEEVCDRIASAYRFSQALRDEHTSAPDLWTGIVSGHLTSLADALVAGNAETLASAFSSFGANYSWFGGITTGIDGFNHWNRNEQMIAYAYFDQLVSLGEALSVLPAENPEQGENGNWGKNIQRRPADVLERIEDKLGISIWPPLGIMPVSGLAFDNGALHYRHINALYTAVRARDLSGPDDAISEYGGGIGLIPLYLHRFGRKNYTLYDLPIVNALSAYFLINALGDEAVCLEGEPEKLNAVKIRTGESCRRATDRAFTLTLNQDSFPEIDETIVRGYLGQIRRTTTKYFLSINHEVEHPKTSEAKHVNVSTLLTTDAGFHRFYRMPYWLRRGYVEELYFIC